jgi:hypothetical protein
MLVVAVASLLVIGGYRYAYVWTPVQRLYFSSYLRSAISARVMRTGHYQLLMVTDRRGTRLALDEEVQPVISATGDTSFALTLLAEQLGDRRLVWQTGTYDHAEIHAFLRHWIYQDESPLTLFTPALWGGLAIFILGLTVAIPRIWRALACAHTGDSSKVRSW